MTISLHGLATALQTLLTNDADTAAKEERLHRPQAEDLRRRLRPDLGFRLDERPPRNARRPCRALGRGPSIAPRAAQLQSRGLSPTRPSEGDGAGLHGPARDDSSAASFHRSGLGRQHQHVRLPASLAGKYPGCGGSSSGGRQGRPESHGANRDHHRRGSAHRARRGPRVGPHIARIPAAAAAGEPPPDRPGVLRPGAAGTRHGRQGEEVQISWISRVPARLQNPELLASRLGMWTSGSSVRCPIGSIPS